MNHFRVVKAARGAFQLNPIVMIRVVDQMRGLVFLGHSLDRVRHRMQNVSGLFDLSVVSEHL